MSEDLVPLRKQQNKKGLGRGLGSLLGEISESRTQDSRQEKSEEKAAPNAGAVEAPSHNAAMQINTSQILQVPIENVSPNKNQPRKKFDPQALSELANSIKEKGIILPIIVRQLENKMYEIIAGERRWRAAQLAGKDKVPVLVRNSDSKEVLEIALIENIQRQELNPIEEADAYIQLATKHNMTQQQIAEKVGKDRATVANIMRLSALTPEVRVMVVNKEIALGQAKVLLSVEDMQDQVKLAKKVKQLGLSVRATEKLVSNYKKNETPGASAQFNADNAAIHPLINELQSCFGTKVEIDFNGQKSKVTLHFYSVPELNQFVDRARNIKK